MASLTIRPAESDEVPVIKRTAKRAQNAVYDDMLDQETIDAALDEWYTTELLREQVQDSGVSFSMQIRVIGGNDIARSFYESHDYEVASSLAAPLFGESIEEVCYQKGLG